MHNELLWVEYQRCFYNVYRKREKSCLKRLFFAYYSLIDIGLRRLASSLYSRAAFYARNGGGQAHALSSGIVSHVEDGGGDEAHGAHHADHQSYDHADHHSPSQQSPLHADPRAIQRQVHAHMSPTHARFAGEHGGVAGGPSVLDMAARVEGRQPIMAELMRRGVSLGGVVDWIEAARNRQNVVMHHDEHHE